MKDELKVILIQNGEPTPENPIEIKRLLVNKEAEDYITNLQEENEKVHKDFNELSERYFFTKTRCEKVIEYIKVWQSFPHTNGSTHNELRNLLNILNGGDEE